MSTPLLRSERLAIVVALLATWLAGVGRLPGLPAALAQSPPAGEATDEELAAARQLFKEGLALEKREKWAAALERFEKVASVRRTPQVRFHVALCHEHLGRLVEAINGFELAEQEARAEPGQARNVEVNAPLRASALRDRIGFVHLTATGQVRSSRILLDGKPVAPGLLDTDVPVDPGSHVVEVETAGKTAFRRELSVEAQQVEAVELPIDDPEPPPKPPPRAASVHDEPRPRTTAEPSRWPAYLVGGVGLAAGVTGAILWGFAQSSIDEVRATCLAGDQQCSPGQKPVADEGAALATAGNVLVPVGGALLGAGVVLFFVLGAGEPDDADAEPAVGLVPAPGGLVLHGAF